MKKERVVVVMGSDSDLAIMQNCVDALNEFGVGSNVRILSAHRAPDDTASFAKQAARSGAEVIIAAAGGSAHLAGVVAAHTILPVIAVPIPGKYLDGIDSLLSMVQMPAGVPVATVAIGEAGARNAGILAVQILAGRDAALRTKLEAFKKGLRGKVIDKDAAVRKMRTRP